MNNPSLITRHQVRHHARPGFTLIELLVVISIISLLVAILLPMLAQARESGRASQCGSNLRQLGIANAMYRDQYKDSMMFWYLSTETLAWQRWVPTGIGGWNIAIGQFMGWGQLGTDRYAINAGARTAIHCPSETDTDGGQWRYPHYTTSNYQFDTVASPFHRANLQSRVIRPETKVVLIDGRPNFSTPWNLDTRFNATATDEFRYRHPLSRMPTNHTTNTRDAATPPNQAVNHLFYDGHVEPRTFATIQAKGRYPYAPVTPTIALQ